jgi:L-amino acid N-acyltransferase YncA
LKCSTRSGAAPERAVDVMSLKESSSRLLGWVTVGSGRMVESELFIGGLVIYLASQFKRAGISIALLSISVPLVASA